MQRSRDDRQPVLHRQAHVAEASVPVDAVVVAVAAAALVGAARGHHQVLAARHRRGEAGIVAGDEPDPVAEPAQGRDGVDPAVDEAVRQVAEPVVEGDVSIAGSQANGRPW